MRVGLRLTALGVLLVAIVLWLFGGAHRGFTSLQVLVMKPDPVTGLSQPVWENQPVLGVDFLAAAVALAGLLFGASWLFRNRSPRNSSQPQTS